APVSWSPSSSSPRPQVTPISAREGSPEVLGSMSCQEVLVEAVTDQPALSAAGGCCEGWVYGGQSGHSPLHHSQNITLSRHEAWRADVPARSEGGDDRAGVGLLDEGADVLGVQQLVQRHEGLVLGVLGADHEHVRIRVVLAGLEREGVLGGAEISLEGVVAVDHGDRVVTQGAGQQRRVDLLEVE